MEQRTPEHSAAYAPALGLLLLAALTPFLSANDYPLFSAEVGILALAAAIAGLLLVLIAMFAGRTAAALILGGAVAFCIDLLFGLKASKPLLVLVPVMAMALAYLLRKHVATIVAVASAVLLLSTLAVPVKDSRALQDGGTPSPSAAPAPEQSAKLPVLLHLILDEQIGIHGIPLDIEGAPAAAERLRSFYLQRNFRVYADAYSEYSDTDLSIPHLLNLSSDDDQKASFVEGSGEPHVLRESAYLRHLVSLGYRLKVYQSDFLDLCRVPGIAYSSCTTYSGHRIGVLYHTPISPFQRARFITNSFLAGSHYLRRLKAVYQRFGQFPLGWWRTGDSRVAPISVVPVFDRLQADLREAQQGTAYVAHLLLPHAPYLFDSNCKPRENIDEWLGQLPANPASERAKRYRYYFSQMRCTERLVDRLFEAMKAAGVWNDAIIIVHGDHGSRIVKHNPVPENAAALTLTDFRDAFSALFALRAPGIAAEEVAGLRPLQALLSEALGIEKTFDPPKVYLRPKQGPLSVCGLKNLTLQQEGTTPLCPAGAERSAVARAEPDRTE